MRQLSIEQVAEMCHEANRKYCALLGDYSQNEWRHAAKWQQDSAVDGVKFRLLHPEAPPSASHDNWFKTKFADGWKYGPQKDADRRIHPCMVPFAELPPEQRAKHHLFTAVVDALRVSGMIMERR